MSVKVSGNTEGGTQILLKAAELLGEKGWCQGTSMDGAGRMCALGAIDQARAEMYNRDDWYDESSSTAYSNAYWRLLNHINATSGIGNVPDWNDAEDRSAEDVILAFKTVAADG